MKTSNKLEYLSRYLGGEKTKKEKKSKKEKRRKDENTKIQDADQADDLFALALNRAADPNIDDSEDDRPVVVESSAELLSSVPKGQWEAVEGDLNREHEGVNEEDDEKPRRRRYDSSSDEESISNNKKQKREKVLSGPDTIHDIKRMGDSFLDEHGKDFKKRRRYDSPSSDDDKGASRRRRHDSSSSEDSGDDDRERTSSGHIAGLQSGSKFSKTEKKLQDEKRDAVRTMVEKYGHGDTVYREKTTGHKVQKSHVNIEEAQRRHVLLNTSQAQRERDFQRQQEVVALQQASFARHADDERLEALRKSEIREGDPMAAFGATKKATRGAKGNANDVLAKPVYKGPPPKPNRFNIRPGFRWDGVDRGNGFEDKLLSQRFQVQHQKEVAYRWSTADM